MRLVRPKLGQLLAVVIREAIREGEAVELDGLGTFEPDDRLGMHFVAESAPRVFIAYVEEESELALRLANDLAGAGFKPWIDKRRLLPGQNWRAAIDRAIDRSDFFVPCFSSRSVNKRGHFPHELRHALRCAETMPLDDTFITPVRLNACRIPAQIQHSIHHVDLFPDWEAGVRELSGALWDEFAARLDRAA